MDLGIGFKLPVCACSEQLPFRANAAASYRPTFARLCMWPYPEYDVAHAELSRMDFRFWLHMELDDNIDLQLEGWNDA